MKEIQLITNGLDEVYRIFRVHFHLCLCARTVAEQALSMCW